VGDPDPIIGLRGDDTADALRDWAKSEITKTGERVYDAAKFAFTAASGSVAVFVAILSARKIPFSAISGFAIGAFAVAAATALITAFPRQWSADGGTDLAAEYKRQLTIDRALLVFWAVCWFVGLVLAVVTFV